MSLTPRQERFVEEYLRVGGPGHLNATQAAILAGYSERNADKIGPELLGKTRVAEAIQAALRAQAERLQIDSDDVLRRVWNTAKADPNELVEYRRTCCRHCHGAGHRYQRTAGEMERAGRAHEAAQREPDAIPAEFDPMGGVGFDPRKAPHPDCPECFGDGIGTAFLKDTRNLSPEALCLYAGVKETRHGIEVKMHDQQAARVLVGKHLGLFSDKHEHTFPAGVPTTPEQAAEGLRRVEEYRRLRHQPAPSTNGHHESNGHG